MSENMTKSRNTTTETSFGFDSLRQFYSVVGSILVPLGLVGNALIIVIVVGDRGLRSFTRILLGFLCLSDTLAVLSGVVRYWLISLIRLDLRHLSSFACSFHSFVASLSIDLSVWALCILSIERLCLVHSPILFKTTCSGAIAGLGVSGILFLGAFLKNFFFLFRNYEYPRCKDVPAYINVFVYFLVDMVVSGILPLCLIIATSIGIMTLLKRQRQRVGNSSDHKAAMSATAMLLVIGLVYLATSLPSLLFITYQNFFIVPGTVPEDALQVIYEGLMLLLMTNYSSRFYLYVMSSRRFREVLRDKFHCCCKSQN